MKKYSIDRIENGIAAIECDGAIFEISVTDLPNVAKEGDILIKDDRGCYTVNTQETERIKKELNALQNSLFDE